MVEVTQEDREAAPAWVPEFLDPMEADMIFQALARHRIAAEQRARIDGFNEGIEAGAGAHRTSPLGMELRAIRALAKPMKGQTDAEREKRND